MRDALEHQLENEIGRLNFEDVYQYMKNVGWIWSSIGDESRTPTPVEMKASVRDTFRVARAYKEEADSPYGVGSAGGFTVILTDGDEPIRILFNILGYRRDRWSGEKVR